MPLPDMKQDYRRVLILGSTGSGKTTLLNQLLGINPNKEKFLAISSWRTTTAQFEIILAPGGYEGLATFLPKEQVRQYVKDCLSEAMEVYRKGGNPREAERKLMEHETQRFRLSFVLGRLHMRANADDELTDEEEDDGVPESAALSEDEQARLTKRLAEHHARLRELAGGARKGLTRDFEENDEEDQKLAQRPEFAQLVDEVMNDIRHRCEEFGIGEMEWGIDGWPTLWQFSTDDRAQFLAACNRLCGNDRSDFGRLLTHLVDGLRVSGPFAPRWAANASPPRLVLLDGEGIDHKTQVVSSVPTSVTRLFDEVDVLLLVDGAAPPLLNGPQVAIRTACASGHEGKLMICFTKLDEVKGADLSDFPSRVDRVRTSLDNFFASIRQDRNFGPPAEAALKRALHQRVFFVSKINQPVTEKSHFTRSQLTGLLAAIEAVGPPIVTTAVPVYDDARLILHVQKALEKFHSDWRARLGLPTTSSLRNEHFTRIRALCRHISELRQDHYDTLRPVADLIGELASHLAHFFDAPARWEPPSAPEEMRRAAANKIKNAVFARLHGLAPECLITERSLNWRSAYALKGSGSAKQRAVDVKTLLEVAAPLPQDVLESVLEEFHSKLQALIAESIREGNGKVINLIAAPV